MQCQHKQHLLILRWRLAAEIDDCSGRLGGLCQHGLWDSAHGLGIREQSDAVSVVLATRNVERCEAIIVPDSEHLNKTATLLRHIDALFRGSNSTSVPARSIDPSTGALHPSSPM